MALEHIADVSARRAILADGVVATTNADGRVSVRRPKFGRGGTAVLRAFRLPTEFTVHLDALGSATWELLPGRTVAQVRVALQEKFPHETDIGSRLGKFLGAMLSRGFIRLE